MHENAEAGDMHASSPFQGCKGSSTGADRPEEQNNHSEQLLLVAYSVSAQISIIHCYILAKFARLLSFT